MYTRWLIAEKLSCNRCLFLSELTNAPTAFTVSSFRVTHLTLAMHLERWLNSPRSTLLVRRVRDSSPTASLSRATDRLSFRVLHVNTDDIAELLAVSLELMRLHKCYDFKDTTPLDQEIQKLGKG